ncbi:hypothetical protein AB0O34_26030 [Sphaerisporangium sp. NPDC088356]|uniref:hypothetical protein n=1 Tax=Sphaerisporangium sp. NPDC088356 TaxID=3154871 RepID=UPI003429D980
MGEAIGHPVDSVARMSGPIIRIHPKRIIGFDLENTGLENTGLEPHDLVPDRHDGPGLAWPT